jgi:hypothetical protein
MEHESSLEGKPCCYCGSAMTRKGTFKHQANYATKDHVVPVSAGGAGRKTVRCCRTCNEDKAHLSVEEYRAVLSVRYRRPFVFYFERLAAYVLWRHSAECVRYWLVSAGF